MWALAQVIRISPSDDGYLDGSHDLQFAFFATRDDLETVPMTNGITAFPRLRHGDADALHALLRDRYDTSIVPGRFFEMPDHFRIGVGKPTDIVEEGLSRLGAALDELR